MPHPKHNILNNRKGLKQHSYWWQGLGYDQDPFAQFQQDAFNPTAQRMAQDPETRQGLFNLVTQPRQSQEELKQQVQDSPEMQQMEALKTAQRGTSLLGLMLGSPGTERLSNNISQFLLADKYIKKGSNKKKMNEQEENSFAGRLADTPAGQTTQLSGGIGNMLSGLLGIGGGGL